MSERHDPHESRGDVSGAARPEEDTVRQWIDLEIDGALPPAEARRLESALADEPGLAAEREALRELHRQLEASRVAVRPGFRESVMARLPEASWEPTGRRGWALALGLAVLLAGAAGLSLATGSTATGSLFGVLGAIGQALVASMLTGAGLLGASWRGVGLALEELLSASPSTLVVLALGVVLLNALFWRLLRRRAGAGPLGATPRRGQGRQSDRSS